MNYGIPSFGIIKPTPVVRHFVAVMSALYLKEPSPERVQDALNNLIQNARALLPDEATAVRDAAVAMAERYAEHLRAAQGGQQPSALDEKGDASGAEWIAPEDYTETFVPDAGVGVRLERLIADLRGAEAYLSRGIKAPTRVVFVGPPGCGKTHAARHIAHALGKKLCVARLDGMISPFQGKTQRNLRAMFEKAAEENGIVFLDEIDGLCARRDAPSLMSEGGKQITAALLQQLTSLPPTLIVIAATNLPDALDPALRRRLPTELRFGFPDADTRARLLSLYWSKIEADEEARERVLARTEGRSGDYLQEVAMDAARAAVRRMLDRGAADACVSVRDVNEALASVAAPAEFRKIEL